MKRLLYITTYLNNAGGVSRILSVRLNYLSKKKDYKIFVVNTNHNSDSFFYSFSDQITIYPISSKESNLRVIVKYKKKLNSIVNDVRPTCIINCDNGLKGSLLPYLIDTEIPIIYERHCGRYIKSSKLIDNLKLKLSNFLLDLSLDKYYAFIVLSAIEKNDWRHTNIIIIPNPLWFDIPYENSQLNKKIAVAVGRNSIEKGYAKLLAIWKEVVRSYPDWILKIYGVNSIQLQNKIEQLKISKNVKCYEPVDKIQDVYLNASMLLNTSNSEAFGLTIIEAMAYGLPVLAFNNVSGPKSIINNGDNGFLTDKNDIKQYVDSINLLIENKELRYQLGSNAKLSIKDYDLNRIMNLWQDFYNSI